MATYLELTNRVLRRLNEVPLTESTFADARGLHATAKDCVNDAIRSINTTDYEWPFNASTASELLVVGQVEYFWSDPDFKVVDFESFQIEKDDTLNIQTLKLRPINRDEWYTHMKPLDDDAGSDGRSVPMYVFDSHGQSYGVTPSPDKAYTVSYRYYIHPTELVAHDDLSTIPGQFDYVITLGALYHMKMFKDDLEAAQLLKREFDDAVKAMARLLIGHFFHATDTRVNRQRDF